MDGPSGASGGDSGQPAGPATKKPAGLRLWETVLCGPLQCMEWHAVDRGRIGVGRWRKPLDVGEKRHWDEVVIRRRGSSLTSMVVYLKRATGMYVRVWGRRHRVEEYILVGQTALPAGVGC